jgi:Na+/phosphate symporter
MENIEDIEGAVKDYSEDLLESLNTVKMTLLEYPRSRRVQELLDIVDTLHSNLETWLNKRQENNDDRE